MSLYPTAPPYTLAALPGGVAGIRETLRVMRRLTLAARKDPAIKTLADRIVQPAPSGDFGAQLKCVFAWVKKHIKYVRDIRDVETVSTPERTLREQTGDCDDMAIVVAALLEAVGFKTRFLALGFDSGEYEHVIAQALLGTRWISLDPTVSYATAGWHPPNETRRMVVHV